nr:zinc-dependent metalloproteinase lipoprotein [Prevotella sp.]
MSTFGLLSCKDSDGIIGDSPITENGQDRDNDIITGDDYVYHLPVIFHVFYDDPYNKSQYIEYIRLKEILNNVNELFQGDIYNVNLDTTASENVHVVFELAQKDANGKTLSTPGVEYIKVSNSTFDCEQFMKDKNKAQYSWNQNDYINVMVYTFKKTSNDSETLGISNLPYQVKGYPEIEGLANGKNYPLSKPGNFPYCVSLNAAYIDKDFEGSRYTTDKNKKGCKYYVYDPNATLAHELGHYLGLFHDFSEVKDKKGNSEPANNENDTDYCTDTPSYNRVEYAKWLNDYTKQKETEAAALGKNPEFTMQELAKRSNRDRQEWQADNLMDYSVCYSMRFTPEQVHRMRQVLYYSPLIPGPKKVRPTTRALPELPTEEGELPIVLAK